MQGTFKESHHGHITFDFDDGTMATVLWTPEGELGDGQGGEFTEENDGIEDNTSPYAPADLIHLAYANTGRQPGRIINPERATITPVDIDAKVAEWNEQYSKIGHELKDLGDTDYENEIAEQLLDIADRDPALALAIYKHADNKGGWLCGDVEKVLDKMVDPPTAGKYTVEIASKSCESNDICVTMLVVEGDKSEIETIVGDVIDEHEDDLTTYDVSVIPYVVPTVLTLDGLRKHLGVEFDE